MALLGPNLDFSEKDFDSLRERLINLVRSAFPDWTDFNVANFGNILLELMAFTGDVLLFYQDNQAGESRITTAQLRSSLIAVSKMLGFSPKTASGATVDLTFSLPSPPVGSVTIEAGDTFRTLEITDPVVFQATSQIVMDAGTDPPIVTVPVENSTNASEFRQSTNLPTQEYELSEAPYLDTSLVVNAGNGVFSEVDDFLDSTATDRHYVLAVDENDRARVRFGNGVSGLIPTGTLTFSYKTGGGPLGNVEPATIRRADRSYTDSFGSVVAVTVTNQFKAAGGDVRQSNDSIKVAAPRSTHVSDRTVGRTDYEINALKVPGVKRALMLTRNQREGIAENQGQLVVIPAGGGNASDQLKADVLAMVTTTFPNTLTFVLSVIDADYVTVDVQAEIFPTPEGDADLSGLDLLLRANLITYFQQDLPDGTPNPNVDFGFNLDGVVPYSDIYNVVRDTTGVKRLGDGPSAFLLNGLPSNVALAEFEFPVIGVVTLINGNTGLPLVSAE